MSRLCAMFYNVSVVFCLQLAWLVVVTHLLQICYVDLLSGSKRSGSLYRCWLVMQQVFHTGRMLLDVEVDCQDTELLIDDASHLLVFCSVTVYFACPVLSLCVILYNMLNFLLIQNVQQNSDLPCEPQYGVVNQSVFICHN